MGIPSGIELKNGNSIVSMNNNGLGCKTESILLDNGWFNRGLIE